MADDKDKKNKSTASRVVASAKATANTKNAKKKPGAQPEKKKGGFKEYFRGVKLETKKVVWPTRKELISYTIVVFIACAFFGLFLWAIDTGILAIIQKVFNISMNTI